MFMNFWVLFVALLKAGVVAHLSPQHFRDPKQPDQFILGYLASLRPAWDIKQTNKARPGDAHL